MAPQVWIKSLNFSLSLWIKINKEICFFFAYNISTIFFFSPDTKVNVFPPFLLYIDTHSKNISLSLFMVFFSSRCEMNETVFKALCGRFVTGEQAIMLIYLYSCQHPSLYLMHDIFSLLFFYPHFIRFFLPTASFNHSLKCSFGSRDEFLYYFLKAMPKIKD